jgi:DNA-binding NtrC family response regulator
LTSCVESFRDAGPNARGSLLWIGSESKELITKLQDESGLNVQFAPTAAVGLLYLKTACFDAVVCNFPVGEWTAPELLEEAQRITDTTPIVVHDRCGHIADAVRTVKLGAYQYLGDGCGEDQLLQAVQGALEEQHGRQLLQLSRSVEVGWKRFLVGESRAIQDVERIIRLVACRRCTVLIAGETGTGKEMVARAIHMASNRSDRVLVPVNCSAIPENLIEAELFGHTKGAFTGAAVQRIGRFEQAQGSTLFLDEISDLPIDLQPKLLRALQEREIQRLGSSETLKVDVRVIAATNANLAEKVKTNQFREDLFYRLNVVPIKMPPLRDRLSDIPMLVYHFVDKICRAEDIALKQVPRETIDRLSNHSWPGNIRELENAVEMAVVLSGDRKQLYPSDFPLSSAADERISKEIQPPMAVPDGEVDFERAVTDFERSILDQALRKAGGNKSIAANMLRLPRTTLISKLRALAALGE